MSDWFGEWDNHASSGQASRASTQQPLNLASARGAGRSGGLHSSSHHYDSEEEHDARMGGMHGGSMSARGMPTSSVNSLASLQSNPHSSVITNVNDPSLSPADQVGGLAGPPMFQLERLDWKPTKEQGAVVGMAVGSGVLLIATANCSVIKWNVDTDEYDQIQVSKRPDERIHKVFMDPTGSHGLIALASGNVYYLHSRWPKAHLLSKVKGVIIESVAWNPLGTDTCTRKILIGTNRGLIYETYIEEKDKYFKKVHDLNSEEAGGIGGGGTGSSGGSSSAAQTAAQSAEQLQPTTPVSGLYMELFPSSVDQGEANHKWFVMAATPNRQFQFIGGPTFEGLFARYTGSIAFTDFPGKLPYADLKFFSKLQGRAAHTSAGGNTVMPTAETCAWMNGVGIYYGQLVFGSQDKGQDVLQNGKLLAYPPTPDASGGGGMRVQAPLSLALTEFHFLLVMRDRLLAINQLSEEVVYEEVFKTASFGTMQGVVTDPLKDSLWLYSDKFVFAVEVIKEDRDAWKLFLRERKFEEALEYCDTDAQEERVLNAKADYLFENASFEEAAAIYAKTGRSFEEVALKFVNIASGQPVHNSLAMSINTSGSGAGGLGVSPLSLSTGSGGRISAVLQSDARAALKAYLLAKLNTLEPTELTQQLMLCTWLTEIFLDNINRLQEGQVESASETLRKRNASASASTPGLVSTTSPFPDLSGGGVGGGDEDADGGDDDAEGGHGSTGGGGVSSSDEAALLADERAQKREDEVNEFRSFLHDYFDCLNRETTFDLIASHGRVHELLYYAQIINDLDWVLTYHLQQANYFQALEILARVGGENPGRNADLFYKFVPGLMGKLPRETVDLLINLGKALDPGKLIPALMRYDEEKQEGEQRAGGGRKAQRARGGDDDDNDEDDRKQLGRDDDDDEDDDAPSDDSVPHHSIRYLEHMTLKLKNRDPVLHNYLISLYARQKHQGEGALLNYLRLQQAKKASSSGQGQLSYDYKYALRVCHEHGHLRACVLIYESMHLYEEATRLALTIDLELAKSVVSRASAGDGVSAMDEQQRKRLWILIARHVISTSQDIGAAMNILRACEEIHLEQVLPYFPDFVQIGEFKEEITKSLAKYNGSIERLKGEMEEYTESATRIRQDISALRARHGVVSSHAKCDLCSQPVLTRHFFLFPCTHAFHTACCVAECAKYLAAHPALRAKVMAEEEAREQAKAQQASMAAAPASNAGASSHPAAVALAKQAAAAAAEPVLSKEAREARCLENYAAGECVLCGEIMIDSVAKPFILMPEEEAEARAWEV